MRNNTGARTEASLTEFLQGMGWWAHDMKATSSGQPCDVVALRGGDSWLLDSKECRSDRFSFERVEPNQKTAFSYASSLSIKCGFAIFHGGEWRLLTWDRYKAYRKIGKASCKARDLPMLRDAMGGAKHE